jgi:hypothetical protein
MLNENIQTVYYNENLGLEEWRYRYCSKTYLCSGGTRIARKHLKEYYKIPKESPRDVIVKNVQKSLKVAFAYAEANLQKRRRLDPVEIS